MLMARQLDLDWYLRRGWTPRDWERLLSSEGMPSELSPLPSKAKTPLASVRHEQRHSALANQVEAMHVAQRASLAYFEAAAAYLHTVSRWVGFKGERKVWACHCEGLTNEEVAARLCVTTRWVRTVVERHQKRAGLR